MHMEWKLFQDDPYLFLVFADGVIQRCIPEVEMMSILESCHLSLVGDHHGGNHTTHKILQASYYWMTIYKYAYSYARSFDQ